MSTQILAAGAPAANSSTVTVAVGVPVTVGLFVAGVSAIPYIDKPLRVQIENPDLSFTDTGVILDNTATTALLIAPGVYRVARDLNPGASVGVHRS